MAKDRSWQEETRDRLKEKASKGRFKLVEGDNTLRILPRVKSKHKVPFYEYMVHREVGPNKRFIRCGKTIHGQGECWLCDKIKKMAESDSSGKQKMAATLQSKEQFVVQVAVVDSDTGKMKGPFLWTVPTGGRKSLSARLLGVLQNPKKDWIDTEEGYNITIERIGLGRTDTSYPTIVADEDSSKVPSVIIDRLKGFAELIPAYSEEQQKAAFFGQDEREEEREDDDVKKKKRLEEEEEVEEEVEEEEEEAPKKKKKKPVEEEEEEETEEEEEEAPKKKKKQVEDEEESEEEEEPEEEEETPKKKKKHVEEEDEEEAGEEEEEVLKKKKKHVEDEEEEEESEEEEEEAPKKKKKHEEEEEEEPEEEEEEEAPKKKKKQVEDEEEEPEEEEEEEEEEERPKKKKKK